VITELGVMSCCSLLTSALLGLCRIFVFTFNLPPLNVQSAAFRIPVRLCLYVRPRSYIKKQTSYCAKFRCSLHTAVTGFFWWRCDTLRAFGLSVTSCFQSALWSAVLVPGEQRVCMLHAWWRSCANPPPSCYFQRL